MIITTHIHVPTGALELEGVEVRVQLSDKDSAEVEDLIPKQVHVYLCLSHYIILQSHMSIYVLKFHW